MIFIERVEFIRWFVLVTRPCPNQDQPVCRISLFCSCLPRLVDLDQLENVQFSRFHPVPYPSLVFPFCLISPTPFHCSTVVKKVSSNGINIISKLLIQTNKYGRDCVNMVVLGKLKMTLSSLFPFCKIYKNKLTLFSFQFVSRVL